VATLVRLDVCLCVITFAVACGGKKQEGAAASGGSAPAVSDAAAATAAALDASSVTAVSIDAAADVVDAAPAAAAPTETFLVVTDAVVPGKLVATARGDAAAVTALSGTRVELRGDGGRVCEATVGGVVPSPRCVGGKTTLVELVDPDGPCAGALYGVTPGRTLKTTKVQKASTEIETAASSDWDANTGRMAAEKQALEGLDEAGEIISVRVLRLADLPALALVYDKVHGNRGIVVYAVSGEGASIAVEELDGTRAPAPSKVVGLDVDGDRALDVVIGHAAGITLISGSGRDDAGASIYCDR
jgi:hypothetical protein